MVVVNMENVVDSGGVDHMDDNLRAAGKMDGEHSPPGIGVRHPKQPHDAWKATVNGRWMMGCHLEFAREVTRASSER